MEIKTLNDVVDGLEQIATELSENSKVSFEVDDYNMLAFIGESLHDINNTLKKIEAKMK